MTKLPPPGRPVDADLVAYLDDEVTAERRAEIARWLDRDVELQQRLTVLASGARSFREAFEPLLAEAPLMRLRSMLAALPAGGAGPTVETWPDEVRPKEARSKGAPKASLPQRAWAWPRLSLIAAGLALFLAGIAAGHWLGAWRGAAPTETANGSEDDWRQAVAQYVSLYSPDTLAGIPDDEGPRQRELAMVGAKLGVSLRLDQLALPGLTLKRAQLLEYDEKPLAQIGYLDPKSGALALCIYADGHPDAVVKNEQRAGLNIVHWSAHGRAFMLVGRAEMPELQRFASLLSQSLAL
jgi:anti-sigma factor RsiW